MTQKELLKKVAKWLDKTEIKYMVTGAWSVIFYGRVRTSHDLDFVVEMGMGEGETMKRILSEAGEDFLWQQDSIDEAIRNKGIFQVRYLPSGDKIDFWLVTDEDFDKQRLRRRIKVDAWGQRVYVTSPEDTILQKLRWYHMSKLEKHLVDAAFVWQLQDKLDKKYIREWARKLRVEEYLPELAKIDLEEHY